MCGRFNVIDNPELQRLLKQLGVDLGLPPRANIAPTDTIALVRAADAGREVANVRWWLTPRWARQVDQKYAMFNARCESVDSSRAFAEPFKRRRGVVPVSSFIEWRKEQGAKQPYLIAAPGAALALAAIWDRWEGEQGVVESCALMTTAAAPEFEAFHHRMPVMLAPEEVDRWLDCSHALAPDDAIFRPVLKHSLQLAPLAQAVNNSRNKALELLEPLAAGVVLGVGN